MLEKFNKHLKKSFSSGPKAKIMLALVVCLIIVITVILSVRKTIKINVDGNEKVYVTYKGTVKDVLHEQDIDLNDKDKVQPSLESEVAKDDTISIKKAIPIKVEFAGEEKEVLTAEDTIGDMLNAEADNLENNGVKYKEDDIVIPGKDAEISEDMNVEVISVVEEEQTETEDIPFETEVAVNDNELDSFREITKAGVPGEKEVTYKVVKHNDEVVDKIKVSEKPITEPQNECVTVGICTLKVDRNGENYKSKKTLFLEATAYCTGTITATGKGVVRDPSGISTIAVDPRVIPLGSLVEVEGYGRAVASDTGGAIKGDIIDVYLDTYSECDEWGRKHNVEVNIIAYPGEW